MSLQKKLIKIAEDMPKVYEAGIDQGKQAEHDAFWDAFQGYGQRFLYGRAFISSGLDPWGWTDTTYNPKYPIILGTLLSDDSQDYGSHVFAGNGYITDTKVDIIVRTNWLIETFYRCSRLKRVKMVFDRMVEIATGIFDGCSSLTDLIFEVSPYTGFVCPVSFSSCRKLTKESIISAFSALVEPLEDLGVGECTAKFSATAVDSAFETSKGAADGSTSAEWAALVATRPSWTIVLE